MEEKQRIISIEKLHRRLHLQGGLSLKAVLCTDRLPVNTTLDERSH